MLLVIEKSKDVVEDARVSPESNLNAAWKRSSGWRVTEKKRLDVRGRGVDREEKVASKKEDEYLIRAALQGDEHAFDAIFLKYKKLVQVVIYRVIGSPHVVEDLTQETFLKVYKHLSGLSVVGCFRSWLTRIASNGARDYLRKKGSRERYLAFASSEANDGSLNGGTLQNSDPVAHGFEVSEWVDVVIKEITALPKMYRSVARMRYLGALTYPEIAREMGLPTETVKRRSGRARVMLQERLQQWRLGK